MGLFYHYTDYVKSMINPIALVSDLLKKGNIRSRKIKKNIFFSIGIKGLSIVTSFLMVPLTLKYLGTTDFGIWLTLSSIIAWIGYFDVGLGNGLRNKFAESIALGNKDLARSYVSTTYVGLSIILGVWMVLFFIANFFLDWNNLLNISSNDKYNLNVLVLVILLFFILRLVLKIISIIIIADQRPALSSSFDTFSNIISLLLIYILTITTNGSLVNFVLVISIIPVVILVLASFIFYNRDYMDFKPSFAHVKFKYFKSLTSLGAKFFIIQIAVLIIFSTDNIIIVRILGPDEVTIYNIAYKYFNIITMLFAIIIAPLWSAYTEAFIQNDIVWIKNINRTMVKFWFAIVLTVVVMILFADWFYNFWVGDQVRIPLNLSLLMGVFIIISTWNNVFVYFINSTGKIRLQVYSSVIAAIINIPISIYLSRELNMGPAGVILGTCICLFPGVILGPIQYHKIINKIDKGIWGQ